MEAVDGEKKAKEKTTLNRVRKERTKGGKKTREYVLSILSFISTNATRNVPPDTLPLLVMGKTTCSSWWCVVLGSTVVNLPTVGGVGDSRIGERESREYSSGSPSSFELYGFLVIFKRKQ